MAVNTLPTLANVWPNLANIWRSWPIVGRVGRTRPTLANYGQFALDSKHCSTTFGQLRTSPASAGGNFQDVWRANIRPLLGNFVFSAIIGLDRAAEFDSDLVEISLTSLIETRPGSVEVNSPLGRKQPFFAPSSTLKGARAPKAVEIPLGLHPEDARWPWCRTHYTNQGSVGDAAQAARLMHHCFGRLGCPGALVATGQARRCPSARAGPQRPAFLGGRSVGKEGGAL